MQTKRSTLLNIANELNEQGKRIQWKIVDTDYRPFADGEFVLSNIYVFTNLTFEWSQYFLL